MERIAMSQQERDWLEWLKRRMGERGDAVVVHTLRGRPSNRRAPVERWAMEALKSGLARLRADSGEQLAKRHVSRAAAERLRGDASRTGGRRIA